jgi:DNA ligase (NAD+)
MTDREIAKDFILMNGGDIEKSITKRLNYLIIGDKYGPAKIQKVEYYNSRYKSNIKILTNSDFEFLIKKFLKK